MGYLFAFLLGAWFGICLRPRGVISRAAKTLAALLLLGALVACGGQINLFGSPTQVQGLPAASPSPTASPSPSVAQTPDPCAFKAVRVTFKGGSDSQLPYVPLGTLQQLDATPVNDSGAIPDGCNQARSVVWAVSTPTTCLIVGAGFNPFLRGLKVGGCSLTATVERVVSDPFSVEVR